MIKILVTGANGFVGRSLTRRLESNNKYKVYKTDLYGNDVIVGNLTNIEFVQKLPDVDVVIHLAAVQYLSKGRPRLKLRNYFQKNNVSATFNLTERYKQVNKFIFIGTSMMYGTTECKIAEDSALFERGNGPYADSKITCHEILSSTLPHQKLCTVVPTIICGPGRGGLFNILNTLVNRYRIFPVLRNNAIQTGVVHVEDFSNLIVQVLLSNTHGVINAQSDFSSFENWAQLIHLKTFAKIPVNQIILKVINRITLKMLFANEQEILLFNQHILSTEQAHKLGWKPIYTMRDCITSSIK